MGSAPPDAAFRGDCRMSTNVSTLLRVSAALGALALAVPAQASVLFFILLDWHRYWVVGDSGPVFGFAARFAVEPFAAGASPCPIALPSMARVTPFPLAITWRRRR